MIPKFFPYWLKWKQTKDVLACVNLSMNITKIGILVNILRKLAVHKHYEGEECNKTNDAWGSTRVMKDTEIARLPFRIGKYL